MKHLFIAAALSAISSPALTQNPDPSGTALSASGGRFVFGQISAYRRDQYMLDTSTGRLWKIICEKVEDDKSCSFNALAAIPYSVGDGKYSFTPDSRTPSK